MSAWRLLLTRPVDESAALAQVLAADGVFSSSLPLLHIEPLVLGAEQIALVRQLDSYGVVIVVSKPAARMGAELLVQYWPVLPRLNWFAVGASTAQILAAYGVHSHFPEQGDDSEALLHSPRLLAQLDRTAPRVLIMRGEGGREWLAERLRALGATVDYLQLYRRLQPGYPAAMLRDRVHAERLNGLVVSSGQGFQHLREIAGQDWTVLSQLPLFVPSQRVAQLARAAGVRTVINCGGANASALREALNRYPAPAVPGSYHSGPE